MKKNVNNINDLKNEYKDFIEYKHLFPEKFDDIAFKLKSEIKNYHHEQGLEEYQRKFYENQARLERDRQAREMPEPVKIDPKELEYQEYLKKQADLENQQWIENMKREREYEAQLATHRERSERLDRENAEIQRNSRSVSNEDTLKQRPKNDFEP